MRPGKSYDLLFQHFGSKSAKPSFGGQSDEASWPASVTPFAKEDMMERPNFFDFAASERCQDAFVCWLLHWAKPEYKKSDKPLHETAMFLLHKLLALHDIDPPKVYRKLEIKPQQNILPRIARKFGVKKGIIDILVLVNNDMAVVIEDKTVAPLHGEQLEYYLEHAKNFSSREVIAPIYLKTGTLGRNELKAVKNAGYAIFGKDDLRKVLDYGNKTGVDNDIYADFRNRLSRGWQRGLID